MRRARPNPAAWIVAAGAVFIVVLLLRACGRGDDYPERARSLASRSAKLGREVGGLRSDIPVLERNALFRRLDGWSTEGRRHVDEAKVIDPSDEHRLSHSYLVAALGVRADALERFRPAVSNALSDRDPQVASSQLESVIDDFRLADRSYALFIRTWAGGDRKPDASRWAGGGSEFETQGVAGLVADLRKQPRLEAIYNLKIASVTVAPKPTGTERDVDQLPFTDTLRVTVVVENEGNQPVPPSPVAAILTSEEDPKPRTIEGRLDRLNPGRRLSVTLPNLQPATGGPINLLRVIVGPVGGERNLLDNEMEYKFVTRRASGQETDRPSSTGTGTPRPSPPASVRPTATRARS
ncbi:MAG TPA: hypothetical protein VNE62_08810 [Actinomycetota bacterium]|nr:hypothetical protein [Actinomycetota bacterium]